MKESTVDFERKYKNAIDRAKQLNVDGVKQVVREAIEYIFPELIQDKDENIRKAVYYTVKNSGYNHCMGVTNDEMLAWIDAVSKDKELPQVYDAGNGEIITYSEEDGYKTYKPKFREGEWIIAADKGCTIPLKVLTVDGTYYCLESYPFEIKYTVEITYADKRYRQWSINDAKDGDILVCNSGPYIFTGKYDPKHLNKPIAYGGINSDGKFIKSETNEHWWTSLESHPASVRERNFLFEKMAEAGFEWDQTNKILRYIKKFHIGDKVHCGDKKQSVTITGIGGDAYLTDSASGRILFSEQGLWKKKKKNEYV